MRYARIVATYDQNPDETLVLLGFLDERDNLDLEAEGFGYVKDKIDGAGTFYRYPFILRFESGIEALADWGGFDPDRRTTLDIVGRRLLVGEKITLSEPDSEYVYTINSIVTDSMIEIAPDPSPTEDMFMSV